MRENFCYVYMSLQLWTRTYIFPYCLNFKTSWCLELQICLVSKGFKQEGHKVILILCKIRLTLKVFLQFFLSSNIIKHLLHERYHVKYYAKYKERQDILLVSISIKLSKYLNFPLNFYLAYPEDRDFKES